MMADRLTFLILTAVFIALYSSSSVAGGSSGVAVESVNGTRKMVEAKSAPSVKVTEANAKVGADRSKVTELPIERKMEGSGVTDSTLTNEKPSTVRSGGGAKTSTKVKTGRAESGEDEDEDEDEEEEEDDYYHYERSNTTNIVGAPCPRGLQRDPNGTCRQHLD